MGRKDKRLRDDHPLAPRSREPEEPVLSRPTDPSPLGKREDRIDILVPADVKERAARVARLKGRPSLGSYARAALEHRLLLDEAEIDSIVRQTNGDAHWRNRG